MASLATPRTGLAGQPSTGPVCKPQRAGTGLMAQAWGNPFGPTDGSITGDFHPKSLLQPVSCSWITWVLDGPRRCSPPRSSNSSPHNPTPSPGSHSSGPGLSTSHSRTEDTPTPPSPTARLSPSTQTPLQTALGRTAAQRPVAPAWVTARSPTSHPASSSLPGTACMGSRNGSSSLHTPPLPLVAPHLPRDQPLAPRGPVWSSPPLACSLASPASGSQVQPQRTSDLRLLQPGTLLCIPPISRSWFPPTGHQQPLSLHQRISCAYPGCLSQSLYQLRLTQCHIPRARPFKNIQ